MSRQAWFLSITFLIKEIAQQICKASIKRATSSRAELLRLRRLPAHRPPPWSTGRPGAGAGSLELKRRQDRAAFGACRWLTTSGATRQDKGASTP